MQPYENRSLQEWVVSDNQLRNAQWLDPFLRLEPGTLFSSKTVVYSDVSYDQAPFDHRLWIIEYIPQ